MTTKKIKLLEGYSYPVKPESVFYNVKQILLIQNNNKAINLTDDMHMWNDLKLRIPEIFDLTRKLEKRYQRAIFKFTTARKAKTLGEFCKICANDLNKAIPLNEKTKLEYILYTVKSFLKEHYGYTDSELQDNANIDTDLLLDNLTRIELMDELENVFNAQISDNITIYTAKTLKEYAVACIPQITSTKKKDKTITVTNNYQRKINAIVKNMRQNKR